MGFLVVGDLDQIQSYVFGSTRLRAIRGASALLEKAAEDFETDENKRYGVGIEFLRRRGGQVVAVLNVNDAAITADSKKAPDEFCARLESYVRRATGGAASITTAHVEYSGTDFQKKLKEAFRKIHKEKDGRQEFGIRGEALLTSSYYHRCDLLPTQPASFRKTVGDEGEEEERYLSTAASARWDAVGPGKKSEFDGKLLEKLDPDLLKPDAQLNGRTFEFPHQPDDLWPGEGDYMGYVAADGNGIGQMLEVIPDQERYKKFSNEMYDLVITAIAQAAKDVKIPNHRFRKSKKGKKYGYVPLAPVIIAGDDISLLVRATHALKFAEGLCFHFATESRKGGNIKQVIKLFCNDANYIAAACRIFPKVFGSSGQVKPDEDAVWQQGQSLTLSIGVAIAKKKFPISVYRRLAGELRDEAKRAIHEKGTNAAQEGGMIDFAVITTATAQSLKQLRENYRTITGERLTLRPYTHNKFVKLWALARQLKELPRSKRKFLYTELFAGREAGEAACRFVISRELDEKQDAIWKAMNKDFNCKRGEAFGRDAKGNIMTPLVDALEIAELMSEEED